MFSTFIQSQRQSKKIEQLLELRREFRIIKNLIESDVRSSIFLEGFTDDNPEETSTKNFSGMLGINSAFNEAQIDQIYFHTHRPNLNHRNLEDSFDPEIHEIGYFVAFVNDEQLSLYRKESFYIDNNIESYPSVISTQAIIENKKNKSLPLTTKIKGFNIRYLAAGTEWLEEWNSMLSHRKNGRIPQAIEITIALEALNGERLEESFQINLRPPLGENIVWGNF